MNLGIDNLRGSIQLGCALIGFVNEDFWHPFDGNGEGYDGMVGGAGCIILVCRTVITTVCTPRVGRGPRGGHQAGFMGTPCT